MLLFIHLQRYLKDLRRPSRKKNEKLLQARSESLDSLIFREAKQEDIPKLAALHVKTWNATYPGVKNPPTYATRESQWKEQFEKPDTEWFCYVIENPARELIGFTRGRREPNGEGNLNKIYLLWDYHRMDLGRKLLGLAAGKFLTMGVRSMTVYADGTNPSCYFYEAMGAESLRHPNGRINHGAYIWRDLHQLSAFCQAP